MYAFVVLACFLSLIAAQDPPPCNGQIKVKPTPMVKSGVPYVKLVVDNTEPIQILFPFDSLVEINKIKWTLNENPIDVDENDENDAVYWKRDASGINLIIRYPKQQYIGNWQMEVIDNKEISIFKSCQLQSPPMVQRFYESFRSTEGYELTVVCKSGSLPYPTGVVWFRAEGTGDTTFLTLATNTVQTHIPGDTLVFKEVQMSDTGVYICNTTGTGGVFDSAAAEIKVKSRFAALWPFIGILAELIILLITIILYERHKAAKKKADAQNESLLATPVSPSGDTKSRHSGVRA